MGFGLMALATSGCSTANTLHTGAEVTPASPRAGPTVGPDRLVLLGTKGGPVADPERYEPASLLVINNRPYIVDAGAGTVHRLAEAGVEPADVRTIFLTHHHLDHTAGLTALLSLNWINTGLRGSAIETVDVYGPPATRELVAGVLSVLAVSERIFRGGIPGLPRAADRYRGHDTSPGEIYADANVTVTALENSHYSHDTYGPGGRDASYAYRFDTAGGSIVFTGDTGPSENVVDLARGADILVSEVLNPERREGLPQAESAAGLSEHMMREHLTPLAVGQLAASAGVERLVLHHITGVLTPSARATTLAEIRKTFGGEVVFGSDLMVVGIN